MEGVVYILLFHILIRILELNQYILLQAHGFLVVQLLVNLTVTIRYIFILFSRMVPPACDLGRIWRQTNPSVFCMEQLLSRLEGSHVLASSVYIMLAQPMVLTSFFGQLHFDCQFFYSNENVVVWIKINCHPVILDLFMLFSFLSSSCSYIQVKSYWLNSDGADVVFHMIDNFLLQASTSWFLTVGDSMMDGLLLFYAMVYIVTYEGIAAYTSMSMRRFQGYCRVVAILIPIGSFVCLLSSCKFTFL